MKYFINGVWVLDENVVDSATYEEKYSEIIEEIITWASGCGVKIRFWVADDNTYVIQYAIIGETESFCESLCDELESMLKYGWKKAGMLWQTGERVE